MQEGAGQGLGRAKATYLTRLLIDLALLKVASSPRCASDGSPSVLAKPLRTGMVGRAVFVKLAEDEQRAHVVGERPAILADGLAREAGRLDVGRATEPGSTPELAHDVPLGPLADRQRGVVR